MTPHHQLEGMIMNQFLIGNIFDFDQQRNDIVAAAGDYLATQLSRIGELNQTGLGGREIVIELNAIYDQLTIGLYQASSQGLDKSGIDGCALIALGGYGREEMSPRSDLDLMFYYTQEGAQTAKLLSDRMLYMLWDLNLDIGYSVRSGASCIEESKDSTVRTSLLDGRFLTGSQRVFNDFIENVIPYVTSHDTQTFIKAKLEEREERKHKYGSSVYLLEPNLKEGEGGLRELQDALWIARVKFKASHLRDLLIKGIVTEEEINEYQKAQNYLWKIRNFLHFNNQRKSDQLTFELQEKIAAFLGYNKTSSGSAVELFMQDYYANAIRIEHLASKIILTATRRNQPNNVFTFLGRRNLEDGFYIIRGELRIKDDEIIRQDPALMMVACELAHKQEVEISVDLKLLIRENLHLINDKVRRSKRMNDSFMAILRKPKGVGQTLSKMHHLHLLNAYIPEFKKIYCKVQFDLYHIYTVDIHSLFAIGEMEKLWVGDYAKDHELLTDVANNIEKRELLLLAILFHDIGKGSGKDHSIRGAEMIPTIARRMRLNREDTQRLQFLVLHHLKMAHISQRRDLQDMNMIAQFAELMTMSENLRMLYLLTFADIKAVGPDVWTEWKGSLLQELYEKTYDIIEKKDFYQEQRSEKARNRKRKVRQALLGEFPEASVNRAINSLNNRYLMSYRSKDIIPHMRLALSRGKNTLAMNISHNKDLSFTELTLATIDSPGLFSYIAGVLASHSINILGAQIHTRKTGAVLDILQVNNTVGEIVDNTQKWKRVERDLSSVIEGRVKVEDLIAKCQQPAYLTKKRERPKRPNKIELDNEVSDNFTVLDIYATDKVGLLYDITRTLKELGLYIAVSKISTKVDQAADVFYVQDIFGQKITNPKKIEEIKAVLLDRLS